MIRLSIRGAKVGKNEMHHLLNHCIYLSGLLFLVTNLC